MSELNERMKLQIALLVGDDLEAEERAEAQRNVDSCPECRRHWVRLRGCLDVLERSGREVEPAAEPSLWPSIEKRLRPPAVMAAREDFNGWVPALSMAAACIALLIAGQMDGMAPSDHQMISAEVSTAPRAGGQHVRWIREEMQRRSARLMAPVRMPAEQADAELYSTMRANSLRSFAPVSWTYPDSSR